MNEIDRVRINILPSKAICQTVREAMYNRGEIANKQLEEEKITLILEKIETDMNNAFALGFNIGRMQQEM